MDADPDKWLRDSISKDLVHLRRIEEELYAGQTRYQHVQILRSSGLGLCLVLDGKIQSSERDEFIYHEALVQPVMIAHPAPGSVFIAGGGEGATLREVLSHKTVKRAVMVDIDEEVVNLCREHLPGLSRGAFNDSRTELHYVDARDYLEKSKEKFDVIIIDLADPIEEGPAYLLYTREFYQIAGERLTDNGMIAVQSGPASMTELLNFTAVSNTLKSVFPVVSLYSTDIPSFGLPWGFCVASKELDPSALSPAQVDNRIAGRSLVGLKFYDGLTHQGIFSIPRYIRDALLGQRRLITDKDPLYLYKT